MNTFLIDYSNNIEYYKPPFQILSELEKEILFQNKPPKIVYIEYKDGGDCVFHFNRMYLLGDHRIIEYRFNGTFS